MVYMAKGGEAVPVKDYLINLYKRNGWYVVEEPKAEPVAEPKAEAPKTTRKRTTRK